MNLGRRRPPEPAPATPVHHGRVVDPGADTDEVVSRRLAGHEPHAGHDTGGLPWEGREVTPNPFAGDTGSVDPRLADVLVRRADDEELAEALAGARLIVPVVAVASETSEAAVSGQHGDAASDMATVVLTAPDGERALPVFTSVDALAAWDPAARPVPVTATAAAQAGIEEGCSVLVLDLASANRRVVRSAQMWALAQERRWTHPAEDAVVRAAVAGLAGRDGIGAVELERGERGALIVVLRLAPGLTADQVEEASRRVAEALAPEDVRVRLDAVALQVRPLGG